MRKHLTFILNKEKNIHPLTQKTSGKLTSNNSLKNFIITHINSNLNNKSKNQNKYVEQKKEEPIRSSSSMSPEIELRTGRWTEDEHSKFIKGILEYGNDWKMVQKLIKTRSSSQTRSHAQKFFLKINKIIKSQRLQSNPETLLKYINNSNKNFNEGRPLTIVQRKRLLNAIKSNLKNLEEEENKNINMEKNNKVININCQKEGEESIFSDKDRDKNNDIKNHIIIIENEENNNLANNSDIEDKKIVQDKEIKFCCKKRKNCFYGNKIFKINKVIKCKYSNNINKINGKSNKVILENLKKAKITKKIKIKKSKNKKEIENKFNCNIIYPVINGNYIINNNIINITNNYNNLICNNNSNNNNNNINYNNSNNMNSFINNNFNINSMNQFNFPEPLIDFGSNLKKNNYFFENEYSKNNLYEYQNKLFFDEIEFNGSFQNKDFNDNSNEINLSIGEGNDGISFINKQYDIFNKYYE